jgi:hypothetical protein
MKKILFFAVLAVALAGYGMHTAGVAHAQTTSSQTDNAAMEQQLQVAKATLINLEMQEGITPQGDDQLGSSATPPVTQTQPAQTTTGLSVSQISAFENVLTSLLGTLSQLNATLGANPNMSTSQLAAIQSTLGGMQTTLVAMANQIATDETASPVAMTTPANTPAPAPTTAQNTPTAPVAMANPATPATPVTTAAPVVPAAANPVQATAQASSIWSFTKAHWPAIVIIILVIAILAILFWPERESKSSVTTVTTQKTVTAPSKTTTTTAAPSVSSAVASTPTKATTTTTTVHTVTTAPADSTKIA